MNCPKCLENSVVTRLKTIDSRDTGFGLRRRKACPVCGHRFSTYELPVDALNQLVASGGGIDISGVRKAFLGALEAMESAIKVPALMDSRRIRQSTTLFKQYLHSIGGQSPPELLAPASYENGLLIASDTPTDRAEGPNGLSPGAGFEI